MKIWEKCILGLQTIILCSLFVLEYLTGVKAGVMQHLYVQKIRLYNNYYADFLQLHIVSMGAIFLAGTALIIFDLKGKKTKTHATFFYIYSFLWFLLIFDPAWISTWPPYTQFLLFFEIATLCQFLLIIRNYIFNLSIR